MNMVYELKSSSTLIEEWDNCAGGKKITQIPEDEKGCKVQFLEEAGKIHTLKCSTFKLSHPQIVQWFYFAGWLCDVCTETIYSSAKATV